MEHFTPREPSDQSLPPISHEPTLSLSDGLPSPMALSKDTGDTADSLVYDRGSYTLSREPSDFGKANRDATGNTRVLGELSLDAATEDPQLATSGTDGREEQERASGDAGEQGGEGSEGESRGIADIEEVRPPAASDKGADPPPPTDSLTLAAESEHPNRAAALRRLFDHASISAGRDAESFLHAMSDRPDAHEFIDALIDHDASAPQPAAAGEEVPSAHLPEVVDRAQQAYIERHLVDALAATGLGFHIGTDGVEFHIVDAAAFTETLGEIEIPAEVEREVFYAELRDIVNDGLDTASMAIIIQQAQQAIDTLGAQEPRHSLRRLTDGSISPSETQCALAENLPDQGFEVMQKLIGLKAPSDLIDSVRQMVMAKDEDLMMEWAVGRQVIDRGIGQIGVDRIVTREDWQGVYGFLERLQRMSPDSNFTLDVRDSLLHDIQTALNEPDPTVIPVTGIPEFDDETMLMRQDMRENATPLLQIAEARIKEILGAPPELIPPLETPQSFEPYREQVDYINARIDEGVDPSTIPGYLNQGGMCYVFLTREGNVIKIPRVVPEDEYLRPDPPPPDAAHNDYIVPLLRGQGGVGLEQLVTYRDYGEDDSGAIVTEFIDGFRFEDLDLRLDYESGMLQVHVRTFIRETCEELSRRGLRPDYDGHDLMYKPSDEDVGIFVIDYGTVEHHGEQPEEAAIIARRFGGVMEDSLPGEPLSLIGQVFYQEYKSAFGETAAAALLDDWQNQGVEIPAGLREH